MPGRSSLAARTSRMLALAFLALLLSPATPAQDEPPAAPPPVREEVSSKWLERMDKLDRALLEELVGYAPPEFTEKLAWTGAGQVDWPELRGRVVIVQSWTNRTSPGRKVLFREGREYA